MLLRRLAASFWFLTASSLTILSIQGCQAGGGQGMGSPAGIFTNGANGTNGADGPASNDTNEATSTPGGVVSAPVDLDGWEPGSKDGAAPQTGQAGEEDKPSDDKDDGLPTAEYVKGPPPPKPFGSSPLNEKTDEPTVCESMNGFSTYHTVTLYWKDGIALDWLKQDGDNYAEKMKKALLSQFDELIKGQPIRRIDACTPKPPSNMGTQLTHSLVFKDDSKIMPAVLDTEVTFHSPEELLEFLSHTQLGALFKLPGKASF